jgi:voltage-gated potassium channel
MSFRWRYLELFIQVLIFYSIAMHFIEVEYTGTDRSTGFWLWSERCVAALFTAEYVARWVTSRRWLYPLRPMAVVDLLAILPFYVGFFVDLRSLRLIRTLRVLRLFKLTRHGRALDTLYNAFHRIRHEFAVIGFALFIVCWCSAVVIFELERHAEPRRFGRMSDAVWYVLVTVTTVGYGDLYPVTGCGKLVAGCTMVAGLVLFGTFISLVGGAFVEELRRSRAEPAAGPAGAGFDELRLMAAETFDPERVLRALGQGALGGLSGPAHPEAVRLLGLACAVLRGAERPPEGRPNDRLRARSAPGGTPCLPAPQAT